MVYRLNAEEKLAAEILIKEFVGGVLKRNSNGNLDAETRGTYNLLENYVNGFHDEETVYREITAHFRNYATTLIGENKARTDGLKEKAPYVLAASVIPFFVPQIAPLVLIAFAMGSTVLIGKNKRYNFKIMDATLKYDLVESLGCRQGARTVKSLRSIIAGG